MSQIVSFKASVNCHSLCVEDWPHLPQNVSMDQDDKNGGPNYLRAWREFHHMTQAELAAKVGTNANMIGYLEDGQRALSLKWLRRLAPALKTRPLFLGEIDPRKADSLTMELAMAVTDDDRPQVNTILETFVKKNGTNG
ncbi:MAG TPA: XRE family transcriptional regulator [Novosphingobium capsulatum]|nr:XRE family transcriptional regulator [Novosphingobium capsulatum]